jgi:hypothetical protein
MRKSKRVVKKSKRVVLFLESLENRVVPSNSQVLLDPHHAMSIDSAITAELLESPKAAMEVRVATESEAAKTKTSSDDMTSSTSESAEHRNQPETENHTDSDHTAEANKTSDDNSETETTSTTSQNITASVESAEDHLADSVKTEVSKKTTVDSDGTKSKDQSAKDIDNVKLVDSEGNSQASVASANTSKSDANNGSTGNASKSHASSSDNSSSESDNSKSSSSADNDTTETGSTKTKSVGDTTSSSPINVVVHGKSQNNQKDSSGSSSSTETSTGNINSNGSSQDGFAEPVNSSDVRVASGFSETNSPKSSGDLAGSSAVGLSLGVDSNTASITGVAAALSAKVAVTQLPAVADLAIPLAIPALDSLAPLLGLGEVAAMDSLAPVASDLIVGFLPVEEASLTSAMQGVLNQIDNLGEQIVGSGAGKWLYPIVFTALAATTVLQLASRRRRQFRRQSVWASESGIWSPTCLGSSWQE